MAEEVIKTCRLCGESKPISEFQHRSDTGKCRNECKKCRDKYLSEYRATHKERASELNRKYRELHRDGLNEYSKNYQSEHLDKFREYNKKYRENLTEEQRLRINERAKHYRERWKEDPDYLERRRRWDKTSRLRRRDKIAVYEKERKERDSVFKLKIQIRKSVRAALKRRGLDKSQHTEEIVGCSLDYLQRHLRMTYLIRYGEEWDGVSPVHIDHIKPLANAKTEDEVYELCRYTNLQLLRPEDNLAKHDSNEPDSWEQFLDDSITA